MWSGSGRAQLAGHHRGRDDARHEQQGHHGGWARPGRGRVRRSPSRTERGAPRPGSARPGARPHRATPRGLEERETRPPAATRLSAGGPGRRRWSRPPTVRRTAARRRGGTALSSTRAGMRSPVVRAAPPAEGAEGLRNRPQAARGAHRRRAHRQAGRVESRPPQGLVDEEVAEAGDARLVEDTALSGARRRSERRVELGGRQQSAVGAEPGRVGRPLHRARAGAGRAPAPRRHPPGDGQAVPGRGRGRLLPSGGARWRARRRRRRDPSCRSAGRRWAGARRVEEQELAVALARSKLRPTRRRAAPARSGPRLRYQGSAHRRPPPAARGRGCRAAPLTLRPRGSRAPGQALVIAPFSAPWARNGRTWPGKPLV